MPRVRSKQIIGDIPVNNEDLTTKKYVDDLFNSLTGDTPTPEPNSPLTIEDENEEVLSGVTYINFRGIDVSAVKGSGENRVDVWIPAPNYAPYFNEGSASVDDPNLVNRNIALPSSIGNPYDIGDWNTFIHPTLRTSDILTFNTNSEFGIFDTETTLIVNVYDADEQTILRQHILPINGNVVAKSNDINISITNWGVDSDRFKASVDIEIFKNDIFSNGGRFGVEIIHNNGNLGIFDYVYNGMFLDTENEDIYVSDNFGIEEGDNVITKMISGVHYYTTNTEWRVFIDSVDYFNSNSYPNIQMGISTENLLIGSTLSLSGSDFTGWTNYYDNMGASYEKTDWKSNVIGTTWNHSTNSLKDNKITVTPYDWGANTSKIKSGFPYLIDTYVDNSDRTMELFIDEVGSFPRLKSDLTPWDNTLSLDIEDNGSGLQVLANRLVYPQFDFTQYEPNKDTQPDYTYLSGNRTYYRRFETDGKTASTGMIKLGDINNITEDDIQSDNIIIELSIDGVTWNTMKGQYIGGIIQPNDSIRTYVNEYNLDSGTIEDNSMAFALIGSTTYIIMRITYSNAARDKYIDSITIFNNSIDGGSQW